MVDKRSNKKINIPLKKCIICGKIIPRNTKSNEKRISTTQYKNAKFCSLKCRGEWNSKNRRAKKSSNWKGGKSKCMDCGKELNYRYSYRNNVRCKGCWIKYHRGNNHCRWKGEDLIRLYDRVRNSLEYREWRDFIFQRDNYTCQECGDNKGGNLNAHHIKPFIEIIKNIKTLEDALNCEELWNINNGTTLCDKCHKNKHIKK